MKTTDSGLTLLVTGGIGVDDPQAIAHDASLAGLYRTLHPEVDEVPFEVEELSTRLDAQRDRLPRDRALDKSQAFFDQTVCAVHSDRPDLNVITCRYGFVTSPNTLTLNYPFPDRSFTYNDNSSGQTRTRLYSNGTPTAHASLFLPAGNWGFGTWPQSGTGFTVRAGFHDRPSGNIGLTIHAPFRPR